MLEQLKAETAGMTAFADVLGHALGIVPAHYTDAEVINVRCVGRGLGFRCSDSVR